MDMGIAKIYRVPICANVILASDSPKLELVKVAWYFLFVYILKNYLPMKFVISRIRFFDAAPILSAQHFFLARTYLYVSAQVLI